MALNRHLVLTLALLIRGIHTHSIINATANPFDGGSLTSCEKPAFAAGSICSDVVDYAVPTSVARLWRIIENAINLNMDEDVTDLCENNYRRVLCLHRFPRCLSVVGSSNFKVILNSQTYTTTLAQNCSRYAKRISHHEKILTVSRSCSPISELIEGFEFKRCLVNQNDLVTPWMMEYLKAVDLTISQENGFLYEIPGCGDKFSFHICNFIGKCTSKGNVEFINSYDTCSAAINCYSHEYQSFAEDFASCDLWPRIAERVVQPQAGISAAGEGGKSNMASVQKIVSSELGPFPSLSTVLLGIAISHTLL